MILQLLSILLLVGTAGAGDSDFVMPKPYVTPDISAKITYCSNGTCKTPCEQKMKEAMKLIRPYIDYGEVATTTDLLYRSPQTKLREGADRLDKRDAAIRRWEAIYTECVK